jgi:plastocyanin
MKGEVHVRSAGTRYPKSQTLVNAEAQVLRQTLLGQGRALEARGRVAAVTARTPSVTAGIGKLIANKATLAVMRFVPDKTTIRAGETVTWTNRDPETPHTVTFGTEPAGGPFGAFAPIGTDGPGHATLNAVGQSVNSGFIGHDVPAGTQFQVTFNSPGTYPYICALHDDLGMVGTITVR